MARAKTLRFTGKYDANGQPDRWFNGVPARDLDAAEVAALSDEEYANITGGPTPLYVAPKPAPAKAPAQKAAPKPKPAAPAPPVAVDDAPPDPAP